MTTENEADVQVVAAAGGAGPTVGVDLLTTPAPQSGPWIVNWWIDLLFFVATPLLIIPIALLAESRFSIAALYFVVVGFGAVGHHLPSFLRTYGDPTLLARYGVRLTIAPVFVLAVCLFFAYMGLQSIAVVLLIWGFWHGMMQVFRFARIYDAKVQSDAKSTVTLDFLMCFTWFAAGVLFSPGRLEQVLSAFYSVGGPLIPPVWILGIQLVWGTLAVAVAVAFIGNYLSRRQRGQDASLVKLVAMATSIGFWWYAMAAFSDILIGILLFEIFHDIQYLALVWVFGRRRVSQGTPMSALGGFLFRRGALYLALYLALVLLYGLPAFLAQVSPSGFDFGAAGDVVYRTIYGLVAASAMLHFYVDSFVWDLADRDVQNALGIKIAGKASSSNQIPTHGLRHALGWSTVVVLVAALGMTEWNSQGATEKAYENLVEAVPQSWQAHARYGAWLLEQNRPTEAAKELVLARELHPDSVTIRCDLGRALRQMRKLEGAIEEFEAALEIDPNSAAAQSELGKTFFGMGNPENREKGVKYLTRAVELSPDNPDYHYDLGLSQAKLGNFDDARDSFNRTLGLAPMRADAYNARGNVAWNTKDLEAALTDFDEAIRIDPQLAKAYRNRAGVWLTRVEPKKAIDDLSQAIKIDGSNSRDFVRRGDIHYSLEQYDKARDDYLDAIRREQRYVEPAERMVALLTRCPDATYRNPEQAIRLARTACQQSGWRDARAVVLLAVSHAAAGDIEQALRWQEQAIQILPKDTPKEVRSQFEARAGEYRQTIRQQQEQGALEAKKKDAATEDTSGTEPSPDAESGSERSEAAKKSAEQ